MYRGAICHGCHKAIWCIDRGITTSLRKMLTIVLSFLIYPKPFSIAYALGLILVFAGIGLESYIKNEQAIQSYINEWKWRRKNGNKLDLLV